MSAKDKSGPGSLFILGFLFGAAIVAFVFLVRGEVAEYDRSWECETNGGSYSSAFGCLVKRDDGSLVRARLCVGEPEE